MPDSKTIDTDELLLYIYDELNPVRKGEIEDCIESNWGTREKLNILRDSIKNMRSALKLKSPRNKALEALKNYAVKNMGINTASR